MTTATADFSPVNIEERKKIGIRAGDTVRVHQKIEEKGKIRLQVFEGLVLAVKHGNEPGATFTVRRVASGVGVERIFPLYSPAIDKIEIVKRAKTRRSKLYYIRDKVAREIRRQMRSARFVDIATESDVEAKTRAEQEANEAKKQEEENTQETEQDNENEEVAKEQTKETSEAENDEKVRKETEAASKIAAEAMDEGDTSSRKKGG